MVIVPHSDYEDSVYDFDLGRSLVVWFDRLEKINGKEFTTEQFWDIAGMWHALMELNDPAVADDIADQWAPPAGTGGYGSGAFLGGVIDAHQLLFGEPPHFGDYEEFHLGLLDCSQGGDSAIQNGPDWNSVLCEETDPPQVPTLYVVQILDPTFPDPLDPCKGMVDFSADGSFGVDDFLIGSAVSRLCERGIGVTPAPCPLWDADDSNMKDHLLQLLGCEPNSEQCSALRQNLLLWEGLITPEDADQIVQSLGPCASCEPFQSAQDLYGIFGGHFDDWVPANEYFSGLSFCDNPGAFHDAFEAWLEALAECDDSLAFFDLEEPEEGDEDGSDPADSLSAEQILAAAAFVTATVDVLGGLQPCNATSPCQLAAGLANTGFEAQFGVPAPAASIQSMLANLYFNGCVPLCNGLDSVVGAGWNGDLATPFGSPPAAPGDFNAPLPQFPDGGTCLGS